jgi:Mn2+/Fe2+ NRAMP family transporter
MFSHSMGIMGKLIFGLGLWGICFSSFVSGTMGYSLIVRDICRRFIPKFARDGGALAGPSRFDPVYRWSVVLLGLSPLYIVFLGVEPVGLTLVVRSAVVMVIPVLVGALLWMANDRRLMGDHRPSALSNTALVLLVLVAAFLTFKEAGDWWRTLVR